MIFALAIVALLLGFVFLLWYGQERVLFQPPRILDAPKVSEQVDYTASDGQRLVGYIVGDPENAPGILLCFHGNADLAIWQLDWARSVERHTGHAVFLAEYRGYMGLGGAPSYQSTKLDAKAAYEHLRSTFTIGPKQVAYFGHSLGSAVAAELAQVHKPRALLLQSPFVSARAMARLLVSAPIETMWSRVSRIHFDTRQAISVLDVPVSVAHGKRDRIVPVRMGLEIYEAAKMKGELLIVEAAGHNNIEDLGGEEYWRWIMSALNSGYSAIPVK